MRTGRTTSYLVTLKMKGKGKINLRGGTENHYYHYMILKNLTNFKTMKQVDKQLNATANLLKNSKAHLGMQDIIV